MERRNVVSGLNLVRTLENQRVAALESSYYLDHSKGRCCRMPETQVFWTHGSPCRRLTFSTSILRWPPWPTCYPVRSDSSQLIGFLFSLSPRPDPILAKLPPWRPCGHRIQSLYPFSLHSFIVFSLSIIAAFTPRRPTFFALAVPQLDLLLQGP